VQADDFGSEVIPGAKDMGMHIQAYLYDGYWEDIGTVEAFYEANLALTDDPVPKFRWASISSEITRSVKTGGEGGGSSSGQGSYFSIRKLDLLKQMIVLI
jgi:ADP-glucose pyrophosphorylase